MSANPCPHCGNPAPAPTPLTPRERQILSMVAEGMTGVAIADYLGLSTNTVAQHLAAVRRKYGVHTSKAAVDIARRAGELTHPKELVTQ